MIDLRRSTAPEITQAAAVVHELQKHIHAPSADLMLVGATARNIMMASQSAALPMSHTADIDVAVPVASREDFVRVVDALANGNRNGYTFKILDTPVDVMPFGGIERSDRRVQWNDDDTWNLIGFAEAYEAAPLVRLIGCDPVRVASFAGQAALKTYAFFDRYPAVERDGRDLGSLLKAYGSNISAVMDDPDYELAYARTGYLPDLAGAFVLGRQVRRELGTGMASEVLRLLTDESRRLRLGSALGTPIAVQAERLGVMVDGLRESD